MVPVPHEDEGPGNILHGAQTANLRTIILIICFQINYRTYLCGTSDPSVRFVLNILAQTTFHMLLAYPMDPSMDAMKVTVMDSHHLLLVFMYWD